MSRPRKGILAVLAALTLTLGVPRTSSADKVDDFIDDLGSSNAKERLGAVVNLGKLGDQRAIGPLIEALENDDDKSVRRLAASTLAKIVTSKSSKKDRDRTLKSLDRAADNDSEEAVRTKAGEAADKIRTGAGGSSNTSGGNTQTFSSGNASKVYIEVGKMADPTKNGGSAVVSLMRQTVVDTINDKAPLYLTKWSSGKSPSDADLAKAKAVAFYVDGSLTKLTVSKSGKSTQIDCSLKLLIGTFPKKSLFGFPSGGATVETGSSERAVESGKQECVSAALEDIVARHVVTTIQKRSGVKGK